MKKMNKKGFTLVEMLVVIAIIAILVSILIPTVLGATKKAKAATDAANLRSALAEFQIQYLTEDGNVTNYTKATAEGVYYKTGATCKSDSSLNAIVIYVPATGNADAAFAKDPNTSSSWDSVKANDIAHFAGIAGTNS